MSTDQGEGAEIRADDRADVEQALRAGPRPALEWYEDLSGQDEERGRPLKEHDLVKTRKPIFVEWDFLEAGTIGTIICVYNNGEAYAIEINGEVVTLQANEIQSTGG